MKIGNQFTPLYIQKVYDLQETLKNHKNEMIEWVNLLESGNYKQCPEMLRSEYSNDNGHYSYCCLGVASFVNDDWKNLRKQSCGRGSWSAVKDDQKDLKVPAFLINIEDIQFVIPDLLEDEDTEISYDTKYASDLNDTLHLSFKEIAKVIKFNFPNWFDIGFVVRSNTLPESLERKVEFQECVNALAKIRSKKNS